MENKSLTIRDIAKLANVSVATVSRVINKSDVVKPETKKEVQEIIELYGFKPNAVARSLYSKRTRVIGCILPDITNQYFARMFLELEKRSFELGYSLFLCNSINDFKMESFYLNSLVERKVDGIFFLGGRMNETELDVKLLYEVKEITKEIPIVTINGKVNLDQVYSVSTDDADAMDAIVGYLYQKGHRSIGLLGGVNTITVAVDKMSLVKNLILDKYPMDMKKSFCQYCGFSMNDGYEAFKNIHKHTVLPSAIIGINDEVAVGVLRACHEIGIKVPEQLSIVGYDNTVMSEVVYPALTTFAHDYQHIAESAVNEMDELIQGNSVQQEILIKGKIIERCSG